MTRKDYWGIAALIIILIAAGGFIYWQWSQVQQMKEQLAQDDKRFKEKDKPVAENELPPAAPGKKWVPHGDHFHQVPIDAPDTWQGESHEPKSQASLSEEFKLDLPDKIPEKFPTEAELRQMDGKELLHLARLYTKESNELRKIDYDAGVRLYNATIPILFKVMDEKADKVDAILKASNKEHRKEFPVPWSRPATEELPAMRIDTKPRASNEGGKQ